MIYLCCGNIYQLLFDAGFEIMRYFASSLKPVFCNVSCTEYYNFIVCSSCVTFVHGMLWESYYHSIAHALLRLFNSFYGMVCCIFIFIFIVVVTVVDFFLVDVCYCFCYRYCCCSSLMLLLFLLLLMMKILLLLLLLVFVVQVVLVVAMLLLLNSSPTALSPPFTQRQSHPAFLAPNLPSTAPRPQRPLTIEICQSRPLSCAEICSPLPPTCHTPRPLCVRACHPQSATHQKPLSSVHCRWPSIRF